MVIQNCKLQPNLGSSHFASAPRMSIPTGKISSMDGRLLASPSLPSCISSPRDAIVSTDARGWGMSVEIGRAGVYVLDGRRVDVLARKERWGVPESDGMMASSLADSLSGWVMEIEGRMGYGARALDWDGDEMAGARVGIEVCVAVGEEMEMGMGVEIGVGVWAAWTWAMLAR